MAAAVAAGAVAPVAADNAERAVPAGSSVTFAIAILLIGMACIGLWIAFHNPANVETGGFPGLFKQLTQYIKTGEEKAGAAGESATGAPQFTGTGAGLAQKIHDWIEQIPGVSLEQSAWNKIKGFLGL